MTGPPIRPVVVNQQGAGQAIQQGLLPLLQTLQQQAALRQRQQAVEGAQRIDAMRIAAQQKTAQRDDAIQLLLAGIKQDPKFATTDTAKQLEQTAGVVGFSGAITEGIKKGKTARAQEFEAMFDEGIEATETSEAVPAGPFSDLKEPTKDFFRALVGLQERNITLDAGAATRLSEAFGVEASEKQLLDTRLATVRAQQAELDLKVAIRRKGLPNQIRVAVEGLGLERQEGINLSNAGVDFIKIYEVAISRTDTGDIANRNKLVSTAIQLMGASKDFIGRASLTTSESLLLARDMLATANPALFSDIELEGSAIVSMSTMEFIMGKIADWRGAGEQATDEDGAMTDMNQRKFMVKLRKQAISLIDKGLALPPEHENYVDPESHVLIIASLDNMLRIAFQRSQ